MVALLSIGRHLRLPDGTKVIVGRHEGENNYLEQARRPEHWRLEAADGGSPVALVPGPLTSEQTELAAAVVAGFSKAKTQSAVTVHVDTGHTLRQVTVAPLSQDELWALNVGAALASRGGKE
jgi:hypothetical protein